MNNGSGVPPAPVRLHRGSDHLGARQVPQILTTWDKYLAPAVSNGVAPHTFMMIVGRLT